MIGWASWAGILALTWIGAFIIAEVIPFFADLLALMSSLFDSFFGWIFWGVAYLRMRRIDHGPNFYKVRGWRGWVGAIMNVFIILVGIYFLSVGTYVSLQRPGSKRFADNSIGFRGSNYHRHQVNRARFHLREQRLHVGFYLINGRSL